MKHLFSPAGQKRLQELKSQRSLLAFDFDGTLSEIVAEPERASLQTGHRKLLQKIAEHHPLAIISGREVSDLSKKMGFAPKFLIGNHGMEGLTLWKKQMRKAARICAGWREQLEAHPENFPPRSGVFLEFKKLSLTLHYRNSPQKYLVRRKLLQLIRQLHPLPRLVAGKSVLNLIPDGSPHKGMAMMELLHKSKTKIGLYVGDDDTDEDVFRHGIPGVLTVRVGQKKGSKAEFYLRNQGEILRLLEFLASPTVSVGPDREPARSARPDARHSRAS